MKVLKSAFIHEDLKNRIYSGEFNASSRLPSEKELAEYYGCSRPTLRKALASLEGCNLIARQQGVGSFLTSKGQHSSHEIQTASENSALFGIVFPGLGMSYVFDMFCSEVARILAQKDCSLVWGGSLVPASPTLWQDVRQICSKYIELNVDGVFFSPIEYTPLRDEINSFIVETFDRAHVPVVLIDSDIYDFPKRSAHDLVSLDHVQSSYILAKYMITQNIQNLHFLSPPMSARTIRLRQIGLREALFEAGIPIDPTRFHEGDPKDVQFIQSILDTGAQGIICSNDGTAIALLETLTSLGVSVPKDLIVSGFDNLSYLSHIKTPLTSIAQPTEMISSEAVRMMLDRIKNPARPPRTLRIAGVLVERRSTKYGYDGD